MSSQQLSSDGLRLLSNPSRIGLLQIIFGSIIAIIAYSLILAIYRLVFHPLAKFPGPKLAGLTYWYECYYDVWLKGRYLFQIEELHKLYGPIVRINPDEVHIADSDFYTEIYHQKNYKTNRSKFYNLDYIGESVAFTEDHDVHAHRRAALTSYFSPKSVRALEHRIKHVVTEMGERLYQIMKEGTIIDLRLVYTAMSLDIVTEYSFGEAMSTHFMSRPEFGQIWMDIGDSQIPMNPFARHFKPVFRAFTRMPLWLVAKTAPFMAAYVRWQDNLVLRINAALENKDNPEKNKETTLIHELIMNPNLPAYEKRLRRLADESVLLVGAGGETSSQTLAKTTFHLLSNPEIAKKLRDELRSAIPDPKRVPSIDEISQLPYLNAVIEEGLRISMPVPERSSRVFQDHTLVYKDWTIPPGCAVSESTYFVQTDTKIFPEPFEFRPERWLNNPGLQKYQVAFGKGRRMCAGINLAYAELRLGIATVFRRFDMELYETTRKDIDIAHDYFVAQAATGSKGVRVKVVGEFD